MGLAASFGIAILNAFEMPITYLKAGIMWCTAWMLKGLLKVPGMSKLMGMESEDVPTNFGDILKASKEDSGSLFGVKYKDLQEAATAMMTVGGEGMMESYKNAAAKAMAFGTTDQIDTKPMKRQLGEVIDEIQNSMPKPEEIKEIAGKVRKHDNPSSPTGKVDATRLDPVVTTLGKVGGGGYGRGFFDMQRENNRLTNQTNLIITGLHETVKKLSGGSRQATFA